MSAPYRTDSARRSVTGRRKETGYHRDVIEAALAHQVANKVEAAYFRTDLLEKRRELMQDWAGLPRPSPRRPERSPTLRVDSSLACKPAHQNTAYFSADHGSHRYRHSAHDPARGAIGDTCRQRLSSFTLALKRPYRMPRVRPLNASVALECFDDLDQFATNSRQTDCGPSPTYMINRAEPMACS